MQSVRARHFIAIVVSLRVLQATFAFPVCCSFDFVLLGLSNGSAIGAVIVASPQQPFWAVDHSHFDFVLLGPSNGSAIGAVIVGSPQYPLFLAVDHSQSGL